MSDLTQFAGMVLAAWRDEGKLDHEPMLVGDLLDRIFPYPRARRQLGIDVSEEYEALMLRMLGEEDEIALVTPRDAAELARMTMAEKLPDLTVLQLLRAASVVVQVDLVQEPVPTAAAASAPRHTAAAIVRPTAEESPRNWAPKLSTTPVSEPCWSCGSALPTGRAVKFCPLCGADQRSPACRRCQEPLERHWKHCPECGSAVVPLPGGP